MNELDAVCHALTTLTTMSPISISLQIATHASFNNIVEYCIAEAIVQDKYWACLSMTACKFVHVILFTNTVFFSVIFIEWV